MFMFMYARYVVNICKNVEAVEAVVVEQRNTMVIIVCVAMLESLVSGQ